MSKALTEEEKHPADRCYHVVWEAYVEASDKVQSPEDAAREALSRQRDPGSLATVFEVGLPTRSYGPSGYPSRQKTYVDVDELDIPFNALDRTCPGWEHRCGAMIDPTANWGDNCPECRQPYTRPPEERTS